MTPEQFRERMRDLPEVPPEATDFWSEKRRAMRHEAAINSLDNFTHWPTINGTMFIGPVDYIYGELDYLRAHPDRDRYRYAAIENSNVGRPTLLPVGGISANSVQRVYDWAVWERESGMRLSQLSTIVEVGGGYGAACRAAYRLGFDGDYVLYDLPEFSLLQQHYLEETGTIGRWRCLSDLDGVAGSYDLLVAICSISEMSEVERETVLQALPSQHLFLRFQDADWFGLQNLEWLERWLKDGHRQYDYNIIQSPHYGEHLYLIAKEKRQ